MNYENMTKEQLIDELSALRQGNTASEKSEREFLDAVLYTIEDGIVACNSDGILTLFNRATREFHGLPKKQIPAEEWAHYYALYLPDGKTQMKKEQVPLFRALQGEYVKNCEMVIAPRQGKKRSLLASGQPLFDSKGIKIGAVVSMHDITDRKFSENKLKEYSNKLEHLVEERTWKLKKINEDLKKEITERKFAEDKLRQNKILIDMTSKMAKVGGWEFDVITQRVTWTDETYRIHEKQQCAEYVDLEEALNSFHPDDQPILKKAFEEAINQGKPYDLELRLITARGNKKWTHTVCKPVIIDGKVVKLHGSFQDITERRQAEEALRESEERFRSLVDNIPGTTYRCALDEHWTMHYMSDQIEQISGYPASDFIGNAVRTYESVIHREDNGYVARSVCEGVNAGRAWEIEYRICHRDGGVRWVYEKGRGVTGNDGVVAFLDGFILEITERKQTTEALIQSEMMNRALLEGSPVCNKIIDLNSKLQFMSAAGVARLKVPDVNEYYGQPYPFDFFCEESRIAIAEKLKTAFAGETAEIECATHDTEGNELWFLHTFVPVFDNDGQVTFVIGSSVDTTERRVAEKNLLQAQKMETVGTLAGGVAHEFNNIIGGMMGYAEVAKDIISKDNQARDILDRILNLGSRASDIVRQMLAFSREKQSSKTPHQIHLSLKEQIKMLRNIIPATIEIKANIDKNAGMVIADATQMQQVGVNLCTNAVHAMEEKGGVLEINLCSVYLDGEAAQAFQDITPGNYAKLTVSDTGPGIAPEIIDRIFDPFFTTKEVNKGTGLGLSVVHGIIKDHGGTISVESEVGKGTTFTVLLPTAESKQAEEHEEKPVDIPKGKESILIVDDEESIVSTMKVMLERLGYRVTALTSSVKALQTFRESPRDFDLIITDLTMPVFTGDKLASEILAMCSHMPVILMTGYNDMVDSEKIKLSGIKAFMPKPCKKIDLASTVRCVLDRP